MASLITAHALDRCVRRWGFEPMGAEVDAAFLDIVEGRARLIEREATGKEQWEVKLGPAVVRVVYDPQTSTIITVLSPPPGFLLPVSGAPVEPKPHAYPVYGGFGRHPAGTGARW